MLCSSSWLSVARAKAVPIPLIFHLLALGQECTKQLRLLRTWVRGLGGRKGVWRTPTASLLHALHTQSHNPFFSPCLHTETIFFQSQATLVFPLCNFCRICIYYFCAPASFLTVSGGIFKPAFMRDAYFRKLKYDRFSYDCYRPQSHKKNRGDRERQCPFKTRKQSNFLTIFKWKDWYDTGYFIYMVLCNRMTSFCTQLCVWAHPSPHLQ